MNGIHMFPTNPQVDLRPPLNKAAQPTIIGFTPVNRTVSLSAGVSDRVSKGDGLPALDSKSSPSTLKTKRKHSQAIGLTLAEEKRTELSKPKAVPRSSRTLSSTDRRISQRLKMTKPVVPRTVKSFQSTPNLPPTETFLEVIIPNSETITAFVQDNKPNISRLEPIAVLSGLGDKYRAAFHEKRTDNVVVDTSEPLSQIKIPASAYPTLSKKFIEPNEGNDVLYLASVQSMQSVASEPEDLQDSLQMNWNDDDFPMDDDGIQEVMTLIEIKQSTSNLAFCGNSDCRRLDDEEKRGDLGWLGESFSIDKHTFYKDGEDPPKVGMNGSNAVSSSSFISNFIQSPSLSSTNHTALGEINDVAAFDCANKSFDDDDLDFQLLEMTEPLYEMGLTSPPLTKPATPDDGKLRSMAITTERVEGTPEPPKLPTEIPWMISFDAEGTPLPFIRPCFPKIVRDRSPILGLTSCMVLRTCFRIGEALNAASAASWSKVDAIVELYARVDFSEREFGSFKQIFQFSDLFTPEKPPFLAGAYGLWRGSELWDLDSKAFLGEKGRGKMARAMGRIRRDERSRGWEMTILSIWPVGWDDVGIVKGLVLS